MGKNNLYFSTLAWIFIHSVPDLFLLYFCVPKKGVTFADIGLKRWKGGNYGVVEYIHQIQVVGLDRRCCAATAVDQ